MKDNKILKRKENNNKKGNKLLREREKILFEIFLYCNFWENFFKYYFFFNIFYVNY